MFFVKEKYILSNNTKNNSTSIQRQKRIKKYKKHLSKTLQKKIKRKTRNQHFWVTLVLTLHSLFHILLKIQGILIFFLSLL